jgi:hypothetical protein
VWTGSWWCNMAGTHSYQLWAKTVKQWSHKKKTGYTQCEVQASIIKTAICKLIQL